jgi:hypothetical protein
VLEEWGFYVTYVTFGSVFARATGGEWNAFDNEAAAIRLKNMPTLIIAHGSADRARTRFRQASAEFRGLTDLSQVKERYALIVFVETERNEQAIIPTTMSPE